MNRIEAKNLVKHLYCLKATHKSLESLIPIIEGYGNGKDIECLTSCNKWELLDDPEFNNSPDRYRFAKKLVKKKFYFIHNKMYSTTWVCNSHCSLFSNLGDAQNHLNKIGNSFEIKEIELEVEER